MKISSERLKQIVKESIEEVDKKIQPFHEEWSSPEGNPWQRPGEEEGMDAAVELGGGKWGDASDPKVLAKCLQILASRGELWSEEQSMTIEDWLDVYLPRRNIYEKAWQISRGANPEDPSSHQKNINMVRRAIARLKTVPRKSARRSRG